MEAGALNQVLLTSVLASVLRGPNRPGTRGLPLFASGSGLLGLVTSVRGPPLNGTFTSSPLLSPGGPSHTPLLSVRMIPLYSPTPPTSLLFLVESRIQP